MHFALRTAFGDSDLTFTGAYSNLPFQGILQGNGAGPAVWLAISTFLLRTLYEQGHFTKVVTPISLVVINLAGLIFVDDTNLILFERQGESSRSLTNRLQAAVDAWQGALHASGGALKPSKCKWSLLNYSWSSGKPSLKKPHPSDNDISVPTSTGRTTIEQLSPHQAVKAVGFTQALSGDMKPQFEAIKTKADE